MTNSLVIMGVAGCGKSSLAVAVAPVIGLPLIEGDDFHSPANRAKMTEGIALTDADRAGWLDALGEQLRTHPEGLVLTCSALKLIYRERPALLRPACVSSSWTSAAKTRKPVFRPAPRRIFSRPRWSTASSPRSKCQRARPACCVSMP